MVRLRGTTLRYIGVENEFQFLYGAIKGQWKAILYVYEGQFQFLYGAIKGNIVYFFVDMPY